MRKVNDERAELTASGSNHRVGFGRRELTSASNNKQWQREPRHWQGRLRSCAASHGALLRMADSEFDRVWYGHCPVKQDLSQSRWDLNH